MVADLPIELLPLILRCVDDQQTLFALLPTSRSIYAETEPLLYRSVRFAPKTHEILASRLQRFYETIVASNGRLSEHVKELAIVLRSDSLSNETVLLLDKIVKQLKYLDAFIFDNPQAKQHVLIPFLYDKAISLSLIRFTWNHAMYNFDVFVDFLTSQSELEHLEVPLLFMLMYLPVDALPRLRILDTILAFAIYVLYGRDITHLRIAIAPFNPEGLDVVVMAEALMSIVVFSAHHGTYDQIIELASRMPNLRYLELDSHDSSVEEILKFTPRLQHTKIRFLRLTSCQSSYSSDTPIVVQLFEQFPALQCLDFQATDDGVYDRWYRDTPQPIKVTWTCALHEAWWHDWERDYRVVDFDDHPGADV